MLAQNCEHDVVPVGLKSSQNRAKPTAASRYYNPMQGNFYADRDLRGAPVEKLLLEL